MELKTQKRLAAKLMKVSKKRIKFDPERLNDIKEAITKTDIRALLGEKAIKRRQKKGVSRVRARKTQKQKSKRLRRGPGSRKGKYTAISPKKKEWMAKIRAQRSFIKELKDKKIITTKNSKELYKKAKGGFFRNRRHIKLYIKERKMVKK
jgi:large subunit ribosomal protein L19e